MNFEEESALAIDGSLVLRFNGYHGASRMLLDRPLLGFGPANYARENIPYWTEFEQRWFASERKKNAYVHSEPLQAGIDAGIPGVVLFLGMLIWAVMRALNLAATGRSPDERQLGFALAACFVAFAVDGVFGFNFHVPVSAGLFLLLYGVLDGITEPSASVVSRNGSVPATRRTYIVSGRIVVVALAILCAAMETVSFKGERLYQQALGAGALARSFDTNGNSESSDRTLDMAYELLKRGAPLLPWDMRFVEAMGQIDLQKGRLDNAAQHFSKVLTTNPNHPRYLIALARTHLNQAANVINAPDTKEAASDPGFQMALDKVEAYAEKALEMCPPLPDAHDALGRSAFLRASALPGSSDAGKASREEAVEHLRRALRLGSENMATLEHLLARAYLGLHEFGSAAEALQQAAKADPGNQEIWRLSRIIDDKSGLISKAAPGFTRGLLDALNTNLNRVMRWEPVSLEVAGTLAVHLAEVYLKSDYDLALVRSRLRQVLALGPAKLEVWGALGATFPEAERLTALLAEFKGLGYAPSEDHAWQVMRTVFHGMDLSEPVARHASGQTLAEVARTLPPNSAARAVGWLADLFLGKLEAAPLSTDGPTLAYVGEVYLAAEWWAKAETALAKAVALLPRSEQSVARVLHSRALARLGQSGEALAEARAARQFAPMSPTVGWNLARRLVDARRLEEAQFTYASLLEEKLIASSTRAELKQEHDALARLMDLEEGGNR